MGGCHGNSTGKARKCGEHVTCMRGEREQGREVSLETERHQIMRGGAKDSGSQVLKRSHGSNVQKGLE